MRDGLTGPPSEIARWAEFQAMTSTCTFSTTPRSVGKKGVNSKPRKKEDVRRKCRIV